MGNKYQIGYYQKPFGTAFIEVKLSKVFDNFRGTNFKKLIDQARQLYQEEQHEEYSLFKNNLPAITFSGLFSPSRSAANLSAYSKLIVLDIDHIGNDLSLVRQKLTEDSYVLAVWVSPSGDGLKFLIESPSGPDDHKEVYKQAAQYFTDQLGVEIDKSGSDVSRLCFISHDPDIFVNPAHQVYDRFDPKLVATLKAKKNESPVIQVKLAAQTPRDRDEVAKEICKKIYHFLRKRNLSITTTYENWIRTAFAISNTFTADYGIKMFLDLCRLDGSGHDEFESEKLIINCYNKGSSSSTFKTIIFLAQEQGYQLDFNKKARK